MKIISLNEIFVCPSPQYRNMEFAWPSYCQQRYDKLQNYLRHSITLVRLTELNPLPFLNPSYPYSPLSMMLLSRQNYAEILEEQHCIGERERVCVICETRVANADFKCERLGRAWLPYHSGWSTTSSSPSHDAIESGLSVKHCFMCFQIATSFCSVSQFV